MAVAVSVAAGAEKVAEVGGGKTLVVVVVTELVAPVAVEEESIPGAATVSVEGGPVAGEPVAVGSPIGKVGPWGD